MKTFRFWLAGRIVYLLLGKKNAQMFVKAIINGEHLK
jgi:hypothetical protein